MTRNSSLRYRWLFILPFAALIAGISGCDAPAELTCDASSALSALQERLSTGQDATPERESLQSRFTRQSVSEGQLSLLDIKETGRYSATETLTCDATVQFSPAANTAPVLYAKMEYSVARYKDGLVTQMIRTSEPTHASPDKNSLNHAQTQNKQNTVSTEKKASSDELHEAAALPDDRFTAVTPEDLLYIFAAQSGQRITDAEKLNLFSVRWLQEKDAEARDALAQKELVRINDRLQQYQNLRDIRFDVNAPQAASGTLTASASYDISFDYSAEHQSFAVSGDFCDTPPVEWRTAVRGVQLMLARVVNTCEVRVLEKDAADISAKLRNADSVQVSTSAFARIVDVEPVTNRILIAVLRQQAQVTMKTTGQPDNILLAEFK